MLVRPINEVPIKITATSKRELDIKQQQMFFLIIPPLMYTVLTLLALGKFGELEDRNIKTALIAVMIVLLFIVIRVVMRWGFNEKALYSEYMREKTVDVTKYWGILDIAEDGQMLYSNGHIAYVIKMERSNIIGRPPEFEESHFEEVAATIRKFVTSGYILKKYSLATTDDNSESFSWLDKNRKTLTNKKLSSVVGDILKYSKSLSTSGCNRYVEYWLVYAKQNKKDQITDIKSILSGMKMTIYKPEILDSEGVYKFITDFYKLRFINFKKCFYHNIPKEQVLRVIAGNIRYRHEAKGTYEPLDARVDLAAKKYKESLKLLEETDD